MKNNFNLVNETVPISKSGSTQGLEYYDLSIRWGHGMPQWPSSPKGIQITTHQFHALNGVQVLEWQGIQHRGTHMDAPIHVLENTPSLDDFKVVK